MQRGPPSDDAVMCYGMPLFVLLEKCEFESKST